MPVTNKQQMTFGGGPNANVAAHLLQDGDVATATNVDFSFEPGGAAVRQGSVRITNVGSGEIRNLYKHYKNSLANSVLYVHSGANVYRGIGGVFTSVLAGMGTEKSGFTSIRDHFYTVGQNGSNSIRDDGTTTTDWIKPSPINGPSVVIQTLSPLVLSTEYWAGEGTLVGSGTNTATFTVSDSPYRIQANGIVLVTDMSVNGGQAIDDYGIDSVEILSSNPSAITKISRDYSINDGEFVNYWHTELNVDLADDVMPSVERLIDSQITEGETTDVPIDIDSRQDMVSASRVDIRSPRTRISAAANSWNLWAVARPQFELISKDATPNGWTNIGAIRIIVEATEPVEIQVRNWQVAGAKPYPLNDADIGYVWWETFGEVDSNEIVVSESAPGVPSDRYTAQGGRAVVTGDTAPAGTSGCTHRFLYRAGGYMRDAYCVATNSIGTATYTDTITDIQALSVNKRLDRGIVPRSEFYNNIVALSEPHYDRVFVGFLNEIAWSSPGRPDVFPRTSRARISHAGDEVQRLVVWPPGLVVINRDSVYEVDGSIFEGRESNYIIRRTGSRHGSKSPGAAIKTPYGIPLIDTDGLYMYIPGQGIDRPLKWAMDRIGDAWRGTATNDPAYVKGRRVPAINRSQLHHTCAEYWNDKMYLAMPTGTNTRADTVFVFDFATERVWWYQYPFSITSLVWDGADSRLLAGTPDAGLMQIEFNTTDQTSGGVDTLIGWNFKTRQWTAPTDAVLENLAFELAGGTAVATAIYDNTSTVTLGTSTNTARDWYIPPMSGQVKNNVQFVFGGTQAAGQQNVIHQLKFDALVEPERVRFWRTEHDTAGHAGEKQWDAHYADIEVIDAVTVYGTVYVDTIAVMTHTITGPTSGRKIIVKGFPPETYGMISYTDWTCASGVFKHWQTYAKGRPEPDRVLTWVSTKSCGDEHEWKTFEPCINAQGGTVTATAMVDGTALETYTMTGSLKQSFAWALPTEAFGRTVYATYSGSVPWKFYDERWEGIPEPDVVRRWKHGPVPFPSRNNLRTWVAQLNPRGVCVGTLFADDVAIATTTFTGSDKQSYVTGLDVSGAIVLQTATKLEAYYTGTGTGVGSETSRVGFKHYDTQFEVEAKPFGKTTWSVVYTKAGGATQLDMARWWSYDIEAIGTATMTSIWDVDGTSTFTQTLTCTGRQYADRLAWPAGIRGRIWQQRLISSVPIQVHAVNLDIERIGVKGFSRVTYHGAPKQ